jgi:hypothetical protein
MADVLDTSRPYTLTALYCCVMYISDIYLYMTAIKRDIAW